MGEKVFLDFLHPDANSLYSVCTNLRRVCEELTDRTKRLENKMVQLFSCVKPMLAAQVGPGDVVGMMKNHDRGFVIETKFDGNRIQVHRSGSVFAYFSRKGINHVADYGHVLDPIMRECVRGDNYILDGELMTWLEDEQRFGKFKEVRSVGIQSRDNADYGTSDAGNKLGRLVYIVFDILMLNGQSLLQRPLFERIQILEQVVLVKDKRMEVVKRFVGRTTQDVEKALDAAIQNKEEGIIVKVRSEQDSSFRFLMEVFCCCCQRILKVNTNLRCVSGSKSSPNTCMVSATIWIWLFWVLGLAKELEDDRGLRRTFCWACRHPQRKEHHSVIGGSLLRKLGRATHIRSSVLCNTKCLRIGKHGIVRARRGSLN